MLRRVSIPSPNYSSRGGAGVTTIVLHTAEGALTYQSLGSFFSNPASGVSSHVGIDDTPNTVGEYVPRSGKAWTAANANPWAVQAELCAFASWDIATWNSHPGMLANTAAWIAEEAAAFGIPLVKLTAAQAQDPNTRGVCQHADLGSMGGGHWDCGPAFPIDQVLAMAAGGASPLPPPPPEKKPRDVMDICYQGQRVDVCWVNPDGTIGHGYNLAGDPNRLTEENLAGKGSTVACEWGGNILTVLTVGDDKCIWSNQCRPDAGGFYKWSGWASSKVAVAG